MRKSFVVIIIVLVLVFMIFLVIWLRSGFWTHYPTFNRSESISYCKNMLDVTNKINSEFPLHWYYTHIRLITDNSVDYRMVSCFDIFQCNSYSECAEVEV